MLVWILSIMQGFVRTGQEKGQKPRSKTGTIFRLTRSAPAYYPAAYHHHRRHEQRASAAHPRPEAPLGPEGLATLALRKLNRQPAGVLALHYTTFRLHQHPGVRTSAKPVCKKRQAIVYNSGQKQARAPARKGQRGSCGRQPSLASLTQRMRVAGSEARVPATPAPRTRINKQILCHSVEAGRDGQPRSHAVQKLPGHPPTRR